MAERKAKIGDRILIGYVCRDEDGTVLEEISAAAPAEITLGEQDVLPALEKILLKMLPGETRETTLKPSAAFGPVCPELFMEVPLSMLELEEPEVGDVVEVNEDGEEPCPGTIVEIDEDSVLVDCNHPLAGKTLQFSLSFIDFAR